MIKLDSCIALEETPTQMVGYDDGLLVKQYCIRRNFSPLIVIPRKFTPAIIIVKHCCFYSYK